MARKHNDEFKREAVRIALTSGLTRKQVASDFGVGFSTLASWIQKSTSDDLPPAADLDLARGNERLRREVPAQLRPQVIWSEGLKGPHAGH